MQVHDCTLCCAFICWMRARAAADAPLRSRARFAAFNGLAVSSLSLPDSPYPFARPGSPVSASCRIGLHQHPFVRPLQNVRTHGQG